MMMGEATTSRAGHGEGAIPQRIPVNVYETTEALVVVAPMPGVTPGDVAVTVEGGMLRLHADLRTEAPKDYLLHEWRYGCYERAVPLPDAFGGPVTASLGNGQLAVSVSRAGARPDEPVVVAGAGT